MLLSVGLLLLSAIYGLPAEYQLKGQITQQSFKADGQLVNEEKVPFALIVSNGLWNIRTVQKAFGFDGKAALEKKKIEGNLVVYNHNEIGTDGTRLFASTFCSTNKVNLEASPDDSDLVRIHGLATGGRQPLPSDFFHLLIWEALGALPNAGDSADKENSKFSQPWPLGLRVLPITSKVERMTSKPQLPGHITFMNSDGMVVGEYRVLNTTNFLGLEIPVRFEVDRFWGDVLTKKTDKTRVTLKILGEVSECTSPSNYRILPIARPGMKILDAQLNPVN
jgi:hypothetical protein